MIALYSVNGQLLRQFVATGTTSLGSYCISATSSHYDWAMKKLKQHVKG